MFKDFIELFKKKEFNAENCRNIQNKSILGKSNIKINEITSLIKYKVSNSNYETTVIFTIDKDEEIIYQEVTKHFKDLGFIVLVKKFEELGDQEFIIISWVKPE